MPVANLAVDQGDKILISLDLFKLLFAGVDTFLPLGCEAGNTMLMRSVTIPVSILRQELTLVMAVHNADGLPQRDLATRKIIACVGKICWKEKVTAGKGRHPPRAGKVSSETE
jgi:hypothetical protein